MELPIAPDVAKRLECGQLPALPAPAGGSVAPSPSLCLGLPCWHFRSKLALLPGQDFLCQLPVDRRQTGKYARPMTHLKGPI